MELFFIHLLKSSSILLLFLLSYYLLLRKETFFNGNRFYLLSGLLLAVFLPFIKITKTILVEPTPSSQSSLYFIEETATIINTKPSFSWTAILGGIYLFGVLFFAVKLLIQLSVIKKIKKTSDIVEVDNFYHVKTKKQISPFSFFKYIFYFPKQFKGTELHTIIEHEKVHARELHSLDILLTEVLLIILWFNPIIWFYKSILKQNLEFLADAKTCALHQDRKNYQYLMLKEALGNHNISIANPFYNSLIKKRIVMLNQNRSKSINLLKLLIILPFLGVFLLSFNTKEVVKFSKDTKNTILTTEQQPDFKSPLKHEDIERVTFGYGETSTRAGVKFHKGIDLVGKAGKTVMASADGVVKVATQNQANGNYIVIEHANGYSTKYLHLKDREVTKGEKVNTGDIIGYVGNTGKSTGPHLHFEILKNGKTLNPASLIPFKIAKDEVPKQETSSLKKSGYSKIVKTIELKIDKNTTEESLEKMKSDLAKEGADFSYTVVRNNNKEIIAISIQITGKGTNGKNFNGNYNTSSDSPINPITILYDDENNGVSFWNSKSTANGLGKNKGSNTMVWVATDEDKDDSEQVKIQKIKDKKIIVVDGEDNGGVFILNNEDGSETKIKVRSAYFEDGKKEPLIYIDGKKASKKQMADLKSNKIKSMNVLKGTSAKEKYGNLGNDDVVEITTRNSKEIIIFENSNDKDEEDKNVFIIRSDDLGKHNSDLKIKSRGSNPLYVVDGKVVKEIESTNPNEIESISVIKGKAARKKYGRKGKNGVVEISTKEKN